MAACRSLQHIFDKSLPENPTLLESLSTWSSIKGMDPNACSSFTELFGELHFHENHHGESNTHSFSESSPSSCVSSSSSSSSSFWESNNSHQLTRIERHFKENNESYCPKKQYMHGHSFSSMSSEGLSHCTEGLGSESSDEVEDSGNDRISLDWRHRREEKQGANLIQEQSDEYMYCDHKRLRVNKGSFPPPVSCIGTNGRPFVNFKSYRENGRFVLQEVRIPQQQILRASRANGRLKLQLIDSDDEDEIEDDEDFDLGNIKEVDEDTKEGEEEENQKDDEEQNPIKNETEEN